MYFQHVELRELHNEAGLDVAMARTAATEMRALAEAGLIDAEKAVPDGVVPTGLSRFLRGIGTPRAEATGTAATVIAAQCDTTHFVELMRARQTAAQLEATGLILTRLVGSKTNTPAAACDTCGIRVAWRLRVHPTGGAESSAITSMASDRIAKRAQQRLGADTQLAQ